MAAQLYLSPHLDDALYACAGWIARQMGAGGSVTVLTICAGDPPPGLLSDFAQELHARWGEHVPPMQARRKEDRRACALVGANVVHLDVPDAVYRADRRGRHLYPTEPEVFGPLQPGEAQLVRRTVEQIREAVPDGAEVYCPAGFGGHVDHRLTRVAAERLGRPLRYYPDFPYAARSAKTPSELGEPPGRRLSIRLSDQELDLWARAAAAYRTQLSTFWSQVDDLRRELRAYHDRQGGLCFWIPEGEYLERGREESEGRQA
jgi:LmbE family N-acetylglucosaminyl deacetylase